ncbi:hypothetical protein CFC21_000156 [Triticum aestivum]|uniref:Uncharacterized protein n=1 Tax=Triticum aestivum TaxID=4565 RepID=A0A3B5YRV1_WHEAT|nr:hypothetical protein CFC21_000156 [Triticum aestivum]
MRLICDGCVPIKSMVGLMCPSIRDPLAGLIFSMADWCSMLVGAIVCGCAVADVQEASVVSVLHRPCLSSICSSSQVTTYYLFYQFDHLLLLHEDRQVNIDAHVSGSARYDSHGGLDGFAVQVRQLLLGDRAYLVAVAPLSLFRRLGIRINKMEIRNHVVH